MIYRSDLPESMYLSAKKGPHRFVIPSEARNLSFFS